MCLGVVKSVAPNSVNAAVDAKVDAELEPMRAEMFKDNENSLEVLPEEGIAVMAMLEARHAKETVEATKFLWGGIYHSAESQVCKVQNYAWQLYNASNTLYPKVFPSVRQYEAEVVAATVDMVYGGKKKGGSAEKANFPAPEACGLMSSGGTESIFLASLGHRERWGSNGSIRHIIIIAETAHPAIKKAATCFSLQVITVPADKTTRQMDIEATKAALKQNRGYVLFIYASAPTFSHGVLDPISELAQLALNERVGLHVDNCLGGVLLSHLDTIPPFDFRIAGITSMSVDLHKYGNCAKGASVVVFSEKATRRASYLPSHNGAEGLYITNTLQGSRNGAIVAQAWATLFYHGKKGYQESAQKIQTAMLRALELLETQFNASELCLLVRPTAAVVPIITGSMLEDSAIYSIAQQMESRGHNPFTGQNPPVMALCLGEQHAEPGFLEQYFKDLRDSFDFVRANPSHKQKGVAAIYGAKNMLPDDIVDSLLRAYADLALEPSMPT